MRSRWMMLIASIALALGTGLAQSANAGSNPSSNPGSKVRAGVNQRAVTLIHSINQGEIQVGKLVEKNSRYSSVRNYARMLVSDHQKADRKLQSVASQAGLQMNVNHRMQQKNRRLMRRLQQGGRSADLTFARSEERDHSHAIHQLRGFERRVTDPGLKSYIAQILPSLQKHLRSARALQRNLAQGAAGAAATPAGKAHNTGARTNMPATGSPLPAEMAAGLALSAAGLGMYRRRLLRATAHGHRG